MLDLHETKGVSPLLYSVQDCGLQSAPWSNGNKQTKNKGKERKKIPFPSNC